MLKEAQFMESYAALNMGAHVPLTPNLTILEQGQNNINVEAAISEKNIKRVCRPPSIYSLLYRKLRWSTWG